MKTPKIFSVSAYLLPFFEIFQNFDFEGVNLNYYIHKRHATAQTFSLVGK